MLNRDISICIVGDNMNLKDKKVMIVGFARSGIGAAKLLCKKEAIVTINDIKPQDEFTDEIMQLEEFDINYELGSKADEFISEQDLIVVSPGVPTSLSFFNVAKKENIKIIGEMELGYTFTKCPISAITGTNGKTTTTALLGAIYEKAEYKTHIAGNIGTSLAGVALETSENDLMSLEVSSFQLETIDGFKPHIAAVLNITPDHLDRHKDMKGYIDAKVRIFENQNKNDYAVLNYDDRHSRNMAKKAKSNVFYFSDNSKVKNGVCMKNGKITFCRKGFEDIEIARPEEVRLLGKYNLQNALAATCIAMLSEIDPIVIRHTLATFKGLEHRLEAVCEVKGVKFINDSKATNIASTICAVESMESPTIMILGGFDKDTEFDELANSITDKIKAVVVIGETSKKIAAALLKNGYGSIHYATDFNSSVNRAYELAKPGYVVLLSPACASYDMFSNYEIRGQTFKDIAFKLKEEN